MEPRAKVFMTLQEETMKRLASFLVGLALLSGCSASHMLHVEKKPLIEATQADATLVILRDSGLGFAVAISNYLNTALIGETKGHTYFVTKVPAGRHYVVGKSENTAVAYLDFEPGKIYYLRQDIWMGVLRARTGYSPLTADEAAKAIESCEFWRLDPANPGEPLDAGSFEEAKEDWDKGVKKDPEGYKALLEYKGF